MYFWDHAVKKWMEMKSLKFWKKKNSWIFKLLSHVEFLVGQKDVWFIFLYYVHMHVHYTYFLNFQKS